MIKVLLALPSLDDLGVQHDVRTLMQYWDKDRFSVKMLLHKRSGNFASQFSNDMRSVEVDDVVPGFPKLRVISRLNGYTKLIAQEKPDAVISFVPYSNYGCAWAKFAGKHKFGLAISEHAHISAAMNDSQNMDNLFMKIYRHSFRVVYNTKLVNTVKCISSESLQDLVENHKIQSLKTTLIYNPVPMEEIKRLALEEVDHPWFKDNKTNIPILINVGRLCEQKRQDLLIKAFAKVRAVIDCRLVLVGSGNNGELISLAKSLGVLHDVLFVGFDPNPWKWMARANLFVLSSKWEGLPCVLSESMVLGLPIVSTECPSGPKEMLLNGSAGYLCRINDIDSLSNKVLYALQNPQETKRRVEVANENLFRFEPRNVVKKYEDLAVYLSEIGTRR